MGIIDVTVEKPALKREERTGDDRTHAERGSERASGTDSGSRVPRVRRMLKTGDIVGGGIVGLLTLRTPETAQGTRADGGLIPPRD